MLPFMRKSPVATNPMDLINFKTNGSMTTKASSKAPKLILDQEIETFMASPYEHDKAREILKG